MSTLNFLIRVINSVLTNCPSAFTAPPPLSHRPAPPPYHTEPPHHRVCNVPANQRKTVLD